jgi:mannose-1-phosphate guanylyltransferase
MKNKNHYVAIMAGGIGSRFWPMSRTALPKQFLDILDTGQTLLQSTFERYRSFILIENIYIVTSECYVDIVRKQLPELPEVNIIGEPSRKNTAPCIAYISMKLLKRNPEANIIVAPSDHLISGQKEFETDCMTGLNLAAKKDVIITMGIKPDRPSTGYGYIQSISTNLNSEPRQVLRFTEKPDRTTAEAFLKNDAYLWNSGIFIWNANTIVGAFKKHVPDIFDLFVNGMPDYNTTHEKATIQRIYAGCQSISIDYAILEKSDNVFVIPAGFEWSDLGTWNSAWENRPKDAAQNAISGSNILLLNSKGCIVHSDDEKLVLIGGVDDLIIVNTPDAIMICKKENEQEIKTYLKTINQATGDIYL